MAWLARRPLGVRRGLYLRRRIEARLADRQDALIKLKADAAVSAYVVIDVMNVMREAGAERVVLLTTPPES